MGLHFLLHNIDKWLKPLIVITNWVYRFVYELTNVWNTKIYNENLKSKQEGHGIGECKEKITLKNKIKYCIW